MIVITLVVVLTLVVAGSLFQLLNLGSYFEPAYPSEETPLSLVDDGIRWDSPLMFAAASYNMTKFYWKCVDNQALGGTLVNDSGQAELSSRSPVTITVSPAWAADMSYRVDITIHDSAGDGVPGSGDYIIFTGPPQQSDTVYTIALAFVGGRTGGFAGAEYDYSIHGGEFYSWESDMDMTAVPWWYYY